VTQNRFFWPAAAAVSGVLAVGLFLWPLAYSEVELPTSLMNASMLVLLLVAAALMVWTPTPFWLAFLCTAAAAPIAVMLRVTVEVAADPTTHNLWPLEVVLAGFTGGFFAFLGVSIGWLIRRARRPRPAPAG